MIILPERLQAPLEQKYIRVKEVLRSSSRVRKRLVGRGQVRFSEILRILFWARQSRPTPPSACFRIHETTSHSFLRRGLHLNGHGRTTAYKVRTSPITLSMTICPPGRPPVIACQGPPPFNKPDPLCPSQHVIHRAPSVINGSPTPNVATSNPMCSVGMTHPAPSLCICSPQPVVTNCPRYAIYKGSTSALNRRSSPD